MDRAEQAASLLPHVARLAEEHGPALKRAHTLLLDGALTGPAGQRLQKTLADQHEDVRAAFYAAFDSVRQVAAGAGPPRVREPYIPGPPRGGRSASTARSGSPDALDQLSTELTRTANSWEDAAQALSEILANLGLSTAPARTISRAAQTVSDQKPAIRRSREELLKTDQQQVVEPAKTGNVLHDGWNAYVHHYLPGLGQGVKDMGLSALAGNPTTAPVYLAIKPKGWLERGPVGQIQGLAQGVQHPIAFAKAAVNWEEWKRDPVRAFGEAAPTIVITAVTGGTGSGSGVAARLAAALRRTGKSETATSARALQEAAAEAPKTNKLTGDHEEPKLDPIEKGTKSGKLDESRKKFNQGERLIADLLVSEGRRVEAVPESKVDGTRTPDALVDDVPVEFKSLDPGAVPGSVKNALNKAKGQASNAIIDTRGTALTEDGAREGLERFLRHNPGRMDTIRILGDGYEISWP
ncbi:hypothetical protein [Actinomadura sp. NAK00032]|uniref:CdiA C-terminal domain-containing protein n=1 Tax=Actinomadura sp. NAK00032 TaxID=2742128 RepID=UPI001C37882F|nr:hypothetical protein [Actinomadura sp. NAK00032]